MGKPAKEDANNNESADKLPAIPYKKVDPIGICMELTFKTLGVLASKKSQRISIAPSDDPLLNISATEAAKRIRSGALSSFDLCRACFKRIQEVQPFLNSVTELFEFEALEKAKEADEYIKTIVGDSEAIKKLEDDKPLFGVPISLKHVFNYKGHQNIVGLEYQRTVPRATDNALAVQRVLNAGAIPICYTNVPTGSCFFETDNTVFGRTKNPHDLRVTPGGSSGGEASLVAAQGSLIGVGTDLGGSVRVPAMLCGVYGHKPGNTCAMEGSLPPPAGNKFFSSVFAIGPIVRYLEDLSLLNSILQAEPIPRNVNDLTPNRLYSCSPDNKPFVKLQKASRAIHEEARNYLEDAYNMKAEEFDLTKPLIEFMILLKGAAFDYENQLDMPKYIIPSGYNTITEIIRSVLGASTTSPVTLPILHGFRERYSDTVINECVRQVRILRERIWTQLDGGAVLIFPGLPSTHYFHNSYGFLPSLYTLLYNTLGLSALAVPMGRDKHGYPLAIQLVGHPNSDPLLFAVAHKLSLQYGGWVSPKRA